MQSFSLIGLLGAELESVTATAQPDAQTPGENNANSGSAWLVAGPELSNLNKNKTTFVVVNFPTLFCLFINLIFDSGNKKFIMCWGKISPILILPIMPHY